MRKNPFKKGVITSAFITMLLITILSISFLPEAFALADLSPQTVIINPKKGHVGDIIRVTGEIDTPNGAYLILFDGEEVRNGTAKGTAVNDTLVVPPRAMGNYTVTLHDATTKRNYTSPELFTVQTAYFIKAVVPSPPEQLQEGESTKIFVNITGGAENTRYLANVTMTDPSGKAFHNETLRLTNTTSTGYGEGNIIYPADFGVEAHTNYTGTYHIAFNETLATANFTVGLTDKLEYRRIDSVNIQGTGYEANEDVTFNITIDKEPVDGYPQTVAARADGFVTHRWRIPDNTTLGTYTATLTSATSESTAKSVPDTQNFTIIFIPLNESRPILEPSSGKWEDQVRLIGEIETFGGNYTILWDGEVIGEGRCDPYSGVVNETFTVPISAKRHHNITLYDNTTRTASLQSTFEVTTSSHLSVSRDRIQEGDNTTITVSVDDAKVNATYTFIVNVKDPLARLHRISRTIIIDNTFSGENSTTYWSDFTDANTDYIGTYNITTITANKILATENFTVSLTDESEYARRYLSKGEVKTSEVAIQGSGYKNETVTINITYHNDTSHIPVEDYPKTENASNGIIIHKWQIPENATLGTYTVTLTNTTIEKPIEDIQNFTLIEIVVSCQAQNKYDNTPLAGVSVRAYRGPLLEETFRVGSRITNGTGLVDFMLDRDHYSFGAYWREAEVGSLTFRNITKKPTDYVLLINFKIKCELTHLTMNVKDKEGPLPFINVTLVNVTYAPNKIPPFQTNYTGVISTNAFTNVSYRIEARRYSHLFFNQSIGNLTKTIKDLTIICPTYTLFIHATDSKEQPIPNVTVEVIERSSGRITRSGKTDQWGSIRLNCTFGRYKVRVSNYSETLGHTAILNETVVDLTRNQFYLVLRCRKVNVDLSVRVVDYFGNPISNAVIKIEREGVETPDLVTGFDGIASQNETLGGDYELSLYVAGRLSGAQSLHLDESKEIFFQAGDYVMVGRYPLEINRLIMGTSLTILTLVVAVALMYKKRSKES